MQIPGSTILLTGASGGLGGAIADELAARGATLIVTARRRDLLEEVSDRTGAEVVVADLAERSDLARLAEIAAGCDVIINNAGIGHDPSFENLSEDDIDLSLDVNLRAPIVLSTGYAAARHASGRAGQVVLIGSLSGLAASPGTRLYNATKFGLRGFSLSFRQEAAPLGIGVSLVSPGFIRDAGMFADGGVTLPAGVRTKAPADVAAGVVKAIEKNPAEVFVSPVELRAASTFGTVAPAIAAIVQKRLGISERLDR